MPKPSGLKIRDVFSISGSVISEIYVQNKMTVHFQGMSKTLQFPHTIALEGAPTCSIGISPDGLYNRLNDAGRLILLNQNAIQFGSAPFIRILADPAADDGMDFFAMLTTKKPENAEGPDDIPAIKNYYHPAVPESCVTISIATPLLEIYYTLEHLDITRRVISPFLCGRPDSLTPSTVEEFELHNRTHKLLQITLVIPRPSLVNLQEKELKPTDQDTVYIGSAPLKSHDHTVIQKEGMRGVIMASRDCADRMVLAVPELNGVEIDVQPYFCLNRLKQDLLLNANGTFYEKRAPLIKQDYGSAVSCTMALEPDSRITLPCVIALDFPEQNYIDGKRFERKYVRYFKNAESRAADMAKRSLDHYTEWFAKTAGIQNRIYNRIRESPSYKEDREGALRLSRLIFNEFSFPISNAAVWIEDEHRKDVARFLECFDYAYINPSDVDWYSMVFLLLFPDVEEEICQRFIDSILAEDPAERFYHLHSSFVEARKHFHEYPEEYEGVSLTQIRDAIKVKGSVAHDLGALPKGHPLRNVSDYAWYNNNYWVDLFPKLALRVLRNVMYTGKMELLQKNWTTLKFGFEHLKELDIDGDGIPEGYHHEVKNTFDNLTLFGIDAYDTTTFIAGCLAMARMAGMMKDVQAQRQYEEHFKKVAALFEKLWRETENKNGRLHYYVTCYDPATGKKNTDVWMNQLDALWYLISIGESPFIPDEKAKKILRTIFENNRTPMGWAMCRTEDGGAVESEQGQDVYTTSNYVFAQLLDYYGMVTESKEVYRMMDRVVFQHANSMITPDNLRAELEKEAGEPAPGPHYIVAAYPRPGAIFTHLVLHRIKESRKEKHLPEFDSGKLKSFLTDLVT